MAKRVAWNKGLHVYMGGKRFEKGNPPPTHKLGCKCFRCDRKNLVFTKEMKEKISLSKLGKKRPNMSGENHFRYKGGMPKCIDCNKQLGSYDALKCRTHAARKGIDNSMYKGGKPKCSNCEKTISYGKKFCKKCFGLQNRGENNASYKGGKPFCLDCNIRLSSYEAKFCFKDIGKYRDTKAAGLKGLIKQQNMKQPTSIEKAVYDFLILKGIIFEKQKLINGKFIVDAYIPSLKLVIEADGCYWHGCEECGFLSKNKRDNAKNAYLTKCGYNLIRLPEHEIKSGIFKERLVV